MLLWRKHPNGGRVAAVSLLPEAAEFVLDRGWLVVNGCRANVRERLHSEDLEGRVALYVEFEEPYPYPHP